MTSSRMRFHGRVALVTGGASGMGRATALGFAAEGAKVAIADLQEAPRPNKFPGDQTTPTHLLIAQTGGDAIFIQTDVSKLEDVSNMVRKAVAKYGRLDILAQVAGVATESTPLLEQTAAMWDRCFNINARAMFFGMQAAIAQMISQPRPATGNSRGKIVNVASVAGHTGQPSLAIYGASKFAVVGMTKTAAMEYAKDGINVNVVCPGAIMTSMLLGYLGTTGIDPDAHRYVSGSTFLPWPGKPEHEAAAILHLCSEEAEWTTGLTMTVDGGLSSDH